jgi:hypothetical protein
LKGLKNAWRQRPLVGFDSHYVSSLKQEAHDFNRGVAHKLVCPFTCMGINLSDEHIVTATEPVWAEQEHAPNHNGQPEPVSETVAHDVVDSMIGESVYECSCGFEPDSWAEVEEHFARVTEEGDFENGGMC